MRGGPGPQAIRVRAMAQGLVGVTGATGFVGGHLLNCLIRNGIAVRALARRPDRLGESGNLEIVGGALEDEPALERFCQGVDAIIHCAGKIAARSQRAFDEVNIHGTERLIGAARRAGVRRFILISSLTAREPHLSGYCSSKHGGEVALRMAGDAFSWTILRPCVVYGPGDRGTFELVRQLSRNTAIIPANENARMSLIHVSDLATGITVLLGRDAPRGQIHEIDDGKGGYNWAEIARIAGEAQGKVVRCIFLPRAVGQLIGLAGAAYGQIAKRTPMISPGKIRELYHHDWASRNRLLQDATPWRPTIGLADGFRTTMAWYREQGWLK